MSDVKLGDPALEPGRVLARDARWREARRPARLRPPLDVGPPLRDLRRPVPADLRGLVAAHRLGARDRADAARPARRRQHVPQPGARRQDRDDARPHQRRPGDPRHRRRVDGARAHAPTASSSGPASASGSTGSTSRSGAMRRLLDGESVTSEPGGRYAFDDLRQSPLPVQKHLPIMIGGSGEKKTLRTVARYADMWNAMGPVDVMAHKVDVLRGHCDAVGRDIAEIEFTLGVKLTIRDTEGRGDRVWKAAMAAQPDAALPTSRTTTRSGTAPPSRSPTGCGPTSSSASRPSSPSSRRRTTSRRSSGSSARSKPLIDAARGRSSGRRSRARRARGLPGRRPSRRSGDGRVQGRCTWLHRRGRRQRRWRSQHRSLSLMRIAGGRSGARRRRP